MPKGHCVFAARTIFFRRVNVVKNQRCCLTIDKLELIDKTKVGAQSVSIYNHRKFVGAAVSEHVALVDLQLTQSCGYGCSMDLFL
jgi:hypothetical protein